MCLEVLGCKKGHEIVKVSLLDRKEGCFVLHGNVVRMENNSMFRFRVASLICAAWILVILSLARALVMVFLVAVADEGIQYFNEGRSGLVEDVVLDVSGSLFVLLWLSLRERMG